MISLTPTFDLQPNILMYVKRQEQRLLAESYDNAEPQIDVAAGYVELEPVADFPRTT